MLIEVLVLTPAAGKSLACLGFFKVLPTSLSCLINAFPLVLEPLLWFSTALPNQFVE